MDKIKQHWENPDTVSLKDNNLQELERQYIVDILKTIGKVDRLADIGCGDATDTIHWRPYSREIFGYDYSQSMLKKAKQISKGKIKLIPFDINKDNLDKQFDVVVAKRCLINLGSFVNQKKAILKIHNSIEEDGYFIMLECCIDGLDNLNFIRKMLNLEKINEPFHNKYFKMKKLIRLLDKLFYIEEKRYFSTYYFLTRVYNQMLDENRYREFDTAAKKVHLAIDIFGSAIIGPQFLLKLRKK